MRRSPLLFVLIGLGAACTVGAAVGLGYYLDKQRRDVELADAWVRVALQYSQYDCLKAQSDTWEKEGGALWGADTKPLHDAQSTAARAAERMMDEIDRRYADRRRLQDLDRERFKAVAALKIDVADESTRIVRGEIRRYRQASGDGKEDKALLAAHIQKAKSACAKKLSELQRQHGFAD